MITLIAESGSSKTDWRIIDEKGKISQMKTIGINPFFQNEQSIYLEVNEKIAQKINKDVAHIYYYGTGVTNAEKAEVIQKAMKKAFPTAIIEVYDDMLAAARSLCLTEPGIACIIGTGSNSCFYDGVKIADQVPPLGFWLGDEGSGGYLGKELVKRYIRNELPIEIEEKFIKRFGKLERTEILENAYQKPFPNRYFAGFSKFIFDNRNHPDMYLLVFNSFLEFFEKTVMKYTDYEQYKVHLTGSVAFYYSDILRKAAVKLGIAVGVILESPIAGLVLFHNNKMSNIG
jgi:glucosamine kinase